VEKYINKKIALENLDGNEKLYHDVLKSFLSQYKDIDFLKLDDKDFFPEVYALKGISDIMGAEALYKIIQEINKTHNRNFEYILQQKLNDVLNEIRETKIIKYPKEEDDKLKLSKETKKKLFKELNKSASSFRPKKVEEVLEEFSKYDLYGDDNALINKISMLLDEYDFTKIQETLKKGS